MTTPSAGDVEFLFPLLLGEGPGERGANLFAKYFLTRLVFTQHLTLFKMHFAQALTPTLSQKGEGIEQVSEDEPRLHLKHPRRIDVGERRDRVSVSAYRSGAGKPAKR